MKKLILVMVVLALVLALPVALAATGEDGALEFTDWATLGTLAGASAIVATIVQITKDSALVQKLPTQVWSYILALVVLLLANAFTTGLTGESAARCLFNAAIVSLTTNGGYSAVQRMKGA